MKVIFTSILNPWDGRHGGGQICVHELASAMARRGHVVQVIYSGTHGMTAPSGLPYRVHFVPHQERLYLNPLVFAWFLRGNRLSGEIIQTTGHEAAFLRPTTGARVPIVITFRHPAPPALLDAPGLGHWIRRARWSRRRVVALLERRALRSATLVISPSAFGESVLHNRGYLHRRVGVSVVRDGTPELPHVLAPEAAIELVCVARLDHHKGIDVLLRAMAMLSDPRPRLDLVGAGLEEARLRGMAKQLGLDGRVYFRGQQDRSGVAAILAGAVALVLPSRSDNFPLVILEAMQLGLPIVATRAGGIPEALRDGEEGLLVPPDEPAALAAAIDRILKDSQLRRRLGAAGRTRVRSFTWDHSAAAYERLLGALLH